MQNQLDCPICVQQVLPLLFCPHVIWDFDKFIDIRNHCSANVENCIKASDPIKRNELHSVKCIRLGPVYEHSCKKPMRTIVITLPSVSRSTNNSRSKL